MRWFIKGLTVALLAGFILVGVGCAYLRPPAGDRAAWEAEQKQEARKAADNAWPGWWFIARLGQGWPGYDPVRMDRP